MNKQIFIRSMSVKTHQHISHEQIMAAKLMWSAQTDCYGTSCKLLASLVNCMYAHITAYKPLTDIYCDL